MIGCCVVCGGAFKSRGPKKTCGKLCSSVLTAASAQKSRQKNRDKIMEKQRERRAANGNAYDRAYRERHREEIKERRLLLADENAAKARARYAEKRDAICEAARDRRANRTPEEIEADRLKARAHYLNNREQVLSAVRLRREQRRDEINEKIRADRAANPEKYRAREAGRDKQKIIERRKHRQAERSASLKLIRELQSKGMEALL